MAGSLRCPGAGRFRHSGWRSARRYPAEGRELDRSTIASSVRDAAYSIISGKGFTSFGVATAIVKICEAIVRDEHAVLPVSSRLAGSPGLPGVCMSMPCVIGRAGIERVLIPMMSDEEATALGASSAKLRTAFDGMQRDLGDAAPAKDDEG